MPLSLPEKFEFSRPAPIEGAGGVTSPGWAQIHICRAEIIYIRGSEAVEGARLEGRPIYKLRIRNCAAVRSISTDCRARDFRRGVDYSIREVDALTSPSWAYIVIEGGKAP